MDESELNRQNDEFRPETASEELSNSPGAEEGRLNSHAPSIQSQDSPGQSPHGEDMHSDEMDGSEESEGISLPSRGVVAVRQTDESYSCHGWVECTNIDECARAPHKIPTIPNVETEDGKEVKTWIIDRSRFCKVPLGNAERSKSIKKDRTAWGKENRLEDPYNTAPLTSSNLKTAISQSSPPVSQPTLPINQLPLPTSQFPLPASQLPLPINAGTTWADEDDDEDSVFRRETWGEAKYSSSLTSNFASSTTCAPFQSVPGETTNRSTYISDPAESYYRSIEDNFEIILEPLIHLRKRTKEFFWRNFRADGFEDAQENIEEEQRAKSQFLWESFGKKTFLEATPVLEAMFQRNMSLEGELKKLEKDKKEVENVKQESNLAKINNRHLEQQVSRFKSELKVKTEEFEREVESLREQLSRATSPTSKLSRRRPDALEPDAKEAKRSDVNINVKVNFWATCSSTEGQARIEELIRRFRIPLENAIKGHTEIERVRQGIKQQKSRSVLKKEHDEAALRKAERDQGNKARAEGLRCKIEQRVEEGEGIRKKREEEREMYEEYRRSEEEAGRDRREKQEAERRQEKQEADRIQEEQEAERRQEKQEAERRLEKWEAERNEARSQLQAQGASQTQGA